MRGLLAQSFLKCILTNMYTYSYVYHVSRNAYRSILKTVHQDLRCCRTNICV